MARINPTGRKRPELVKSENCLMPFGKYKGRRIGEIIELNPQYVRWLLENTDLDISFELLEKLENEEDWFKKSLT